MNVIGNLRKAVSSTLIVATGLIVGGCEDCQRYEVTEKSAEPEPDVLETVVNELEITGVETDLWLLDFSGVIGNANQFKFKYKPWGGTTMENRISANKALLIGDVFFETEPGKDRFKLIGIETQEEERRFGKALRKRAVIEDLSESKKGRIYELKYRIDVTERSKAIQYDHTVVFKYEDPEIIGNEFSVKEGSSFTLPFLKDRQIKVAEVQVEDHGLPAHRVVSVLLEYEVDGKTKTRRISFRQSLNHQEDKP